VGAEAVGVAGEGDGLYCCLDYLGPLFWRDCEAGSEVRNARRDEVVFATNVHAHVNKPCVTLGAFSAFFLVNLFLKKYTD